MLLVGNAMLVPKERRPAQSCYCQRRRMKQTGRVLLQFSSELLLNHNIWHREGTAVLLRWGGEAF